MKTAFASAARILFHCLPARRLFFIGGFALISMNAAAQLPFFTQYQQNALNINPALTGYFDDEIKWSGLYRSQAYSRLVTSTFYNTSLQMRPYLNFVSDNDQVGFGINAYSNKTLDVFSHQAVAASFSFTKSLNYDASQSLTIGFQGRYNTKRIDYTRLLFPNQFDVIGYTFTLPNNEPIQVINANYFDLNAGIMFESMNESESFSAGVSMYNINQISTFKANVANRYSQSINYHIGYSRFTSEFSQIFLGALHSTAGKQNVTSLVAAYQYMPDYAPKIGFDLGTIYTINNAISPYLTANMGTLRTSFTYNIPIKPNISYLQNANSFEIGFQLLFTRSSQENSLARRHMSCFK